MNFNKFEELYLNGDIKEEDRYFYFYSTYTDVIIGTYTAQDIHNKGDDSIYRVFKNRRTAAVFVFNRIYENGYTKCIGSIGDIRDVAYVILVLLKRCKRGEKNI